MATCVCIYLQIIYFLFRPKSLAIYLISPQKKKRILWVLIKNASTNVYFHGEISKTNFLDTPIIWSYVCQWFHNKKLFSELCAVNWMHKGRCWAHAQTFTKATCWINKQKTNKQKKNKQTKKKKTKTKKQTKQNKKTKQKNKKKKKKTTTKHTVLI